ncbi:MAG: alpha-L-fucosidase [Massilioclostridium sp.]|nr:alpha-L-fucosidase [Massilioclostridium sp.]
MKQKRMNFSRMGKTLVAALLSAALLLPTVGTAVQASDILSSQTETVQVIRPYITGMETVGTELKGMYTYYDVNGRPEAGSSFRWLRCDTKLGVYTEIPGATGSNYTLTPEDAGKYIRFEVTPRTSDEAGSAQQSWMIGPVLTAEQYERIDNRFDNDNDFMANVNSIQSDIASRLANAVYFTVDSEGLHGSEVFYKNNVQGDFDPSTKPVVQDGTVYAPAAFFTLLLDAEAPDVEATTIDGATYYNLKQAAAVLDKQMWSGDEQQSEIANFQMEHLGQGLIVLSDTEAIFDPVTDRDLIDEACNMLYTLRATEEQMQWFRDAKYGMFLHWDPSSQIGVEISWDRKAFRPADIGSSYYNAIDPEYDTLGQTFNPTEYNPDEWMQLAKEAGMKYVVLTTKHHASYSNFFSDYDNHTIKETPYNQDIVEKYVAAAKKAGLKVGFYYSARDWYNPNYLTADHHRYLEYYFGQIQELMTNYGDIDVMWFDSIGTSSLNQWDPRTLLRRMKQINPDVIVNNRYTAVLAGYDKSPYDVNGDWYTPEHRLGGFDSSRPWESCMTVTEAPGGGWSYRPNGRVKSVEESVKYLINNVVNDGNLLYNIGPMPNGKLNETHADVFRQVGKWLEPYKEAIYNTRGGPYQNPQWGGSTYRTDENGLETIYLHVTPLLKGYTPSGNSLQIDAPGNGQTYSSASLVKDGKEVQLTYNEDGILLTLPEGESWDAYDTVIRLTPDIAATLASKISQAQSYADSLTSELLATVRQIVENQVAEAKQVLDSGETSRYTEQLGLLNNCVQYARSAEALADAVVSAEQKMESVAVGTNPWECPQYLYDSLQNNISAAKSLLDAADSTAAQFDKSASALNTAVESLNDLMNSLVITFTPDQGRVDNGTTFSMSQSWQELNIRYTLDGSEPDVSSAIYQGEQLTIPAGIMTVKAALFDANGKKVGATCKHTYLNTENVQNLSPLASSVQASSIYSESYTGAKACDGNMNTRWATPDGTITATLELQFDSPQTVNTAQIQEYLDSGETTRISKFAIEYWQDGGWKQAYTGDKVGANKVFSFAEFTSDRVRLNIESCMNVTIWEFSLFQLEDSVGVTADKTNLRPNETAQLAVSGQLADGKPITPEMIEDVTYHTDRDDLVSIDETGKLRIKEFSDEISFAVWADVTFNGKTVTTEKLSFKASVLGENLALGKTASASSVYGGGFEAPKAVDGNDRTRWASKVSSSYWFEVDFGKEEQVNNIAFQVYSDRSDPVNYEVYTDFKIQYLKDGTWMDAYDSSSMTHQITYPVYNGTESYNNVWIDSSGTVKSTDYLVSFDTVTASKIRLFSDNTKKDPSIIEFGAYYVPEQAILDKSGLDAAIQQAAEYEGKESEYTADSWAALCTALETANTVFADPDADQETVDAAATALQEAIDGLVKREPVETNKTILKKVLDYAVQAKAGEEYANVIASVKASFDAALLAADRVYQDAAASQAEVDRAWMDLLSEIHKLGFQAGDKTQLELLLSYAKTIDLTNYVQQGQAEYTAALAAAQVCFEDGDALTNEVNLAAQQLLDAMMNLRLKADKSILEELLVRSGRIDTTLYSAETIDSFLQAKKEAERVFADSESTQQAVDSAADNLERALERLLPLEAPAIQGHQGNSTSANGSPKTGDPFSVACILLLAASGSVLLKKKQRPDSNK